MVGVDNKSWATCHRQTCINKALKTYKKGLRSSNPQHHLLTSSPPYMSSTSDPSLFLPLDVRQVPYHYHQTFYSNTLIHNYRQKFHQLIILELSDADLEMRKLEEKRKDLAARIKCLQAEADTLYHKSFSTPGGPWICNPGDETCKCT
jgi:hypothetical protein